MNSKANTFTMNGKKKGFQLNLSTKGHCFLCLKVLKLNSVSFEQQQQQQNNPTSSSSQPFRNLCNHLKINLGKLVRENIKTPLIIEKLASSIEKPNLKVFLCSPCEGVALRFSTLFQDLERIKLEMDYCLERISKGISEGEGNPELLHSYQELMSEDMNSLFMLGFIDELKKEIAQKCSNPRFSQRKSTVKLRCVTQNFIKQSINRAGNEPESLKNDEDDDIDTDTFEPDPGISDEEIEAEPCSSKRIKENHKKEVDEEIKVTPNQKPQVTTNLLRQKSDDNLETDQDYNDKGKETDSTDDHDDIFFPVKRSFLKKSETVFKQDFSNYKRPDKRLKLSSFVMKRGKYLCTFPSCMKEFKSKYFARCHQTKHNIKNVKVDDKKIKDRIIKIGKVTKKRGGIIGGGCLETFDETTGKFKCRVPSCSELFENRKLEYKHCRSFHISHIRKRSAPFRKYVRSNHTDLKKYLMDERTGKYKCLDENCSNQFTSRQSAHAHYKAVHLNIRYKCSGCDRQVPDKQSLKRHQEKCKSAIKEQDFLPKTSKLKKGPSSRRIKNNLKLKKKLASANASIKYIVDNATGKIKCPDTNCSKQFSLKSSALAHYKAVHLGFRFVCSHCNQGDFLYRGSLINHKKTCQGTATTFSGTKRRNFSANTQTPDKKEASRGKVKCRWNSCPRLFISDHAAHLHYRKTHFNPVNNGLHLLLNGRFGFGSRLKRGGRKQSALKTNSKSKTGPFNCDACNKPFNSRYNRDDHYKAFHLNDKYKCDRCNGKEFTYRSALYIHKKSCPMSPAANANKDDDSSLATAAATEETEYSLESYNHNQDGEREENENTAGANAADPIVLDQIKLSPQRPTSPENLVEVEEPEPPTTTHNIIPEAEESEEASTTASAAIDRDNVPAVKAAFLQTLNLISS